VRPRLRDRELAGQEADGSGFEVSGPRKPAMGGPGGDDAPGATATLPPWARAACPYRHHVRPRGMTRCRGTLRVPDDRATSQMHEISDARTRCALDYAIASLPDRRRTRSGFEVSGPRETGHGGPGGRDDAPGATATLPPWARAACPYGHHVRPRGMTRCRGTLRVPDDRATSQMHEISDPTRSGFEVSGPREAGHGGTGGATVPPGRRRHCLLGHAQRAPTDTVSDRAG